MQSTERGAGKHTAFVAPVRRVEMPDLPTKSEVTHTIDTVPHATQHVEMRTSAVDRAKGHLIAMVPMYAACGGSTAAVCVLGFGMPWLSLPTITIFFIVFTAAWLVTWLRQLQISPEGVNHMEAREKWSIIRAEHDRRWQHWERMVGVGHDDE